MPRTLGGRSRDAARGPNADDRRVPGRPVEIPMLELQAAIGNAGVLEALRAGAAEALSRAGPAGNRAIQQLLPGSGRRGDRPGQTVARLAAPTAPGGPLPITLQRLSAEVGFAQDKDPPHDWFVEKARMERGEGTSGGAHSTAFVVFLEAATNAVIGKSFKDAVEYLVALCEHVKELPNYKRASAEDPADVQHVDTEVGRIIGINDYANPDTVADIRKATVLQNLMKDYCLLRNRVPGTYIPDQSGSKSKGDKQEKAGANQMTSASRELGKAGSDPGGGNLKAFGEGMWLTFDAGDLPNKTTWRKDFKNKKAYLEEVAYKLANHILTVIVSYPELPPEKEAPAAKNFLMRAVGSIAYATNAEQTGVKQIVGDLTGLEL